AYNPPLDKDAFAGDRGYAITYYDHPLQAGIECSWSDQNSSSGRAGNKSSLAALRTIDSVTVERRRLAALEWVAPAGTAATPAAAAAPVAACEAIPGEGFGPERLGLAAKALARREPDLGSFTIHRLRKELEELLQVESGSLQAEGSSKLMGFVLEAADELEDEGHDSAPQGPAAASSPSQEAVPGVAAAPASISVEPVAAASASPAASAALAPAEAGCGAVVEPFWRRFVDDARKLIYGRL
ncbi:unnamed protein product, partial [Polarella glacialis]